MSLAADKPFLDAIARNKAQAEEAQHDAPDDHVTADSLTTQPQQKQKI